MLRRSLGALGLSLAFAVATAACGGKILDVRDGKGGGPDPTPTSEPTVPPEDPVAPSAPSAPPATAPSIARAPTEPCEVICDRNTKCIGAYDCVALCKQDELHAQCGQHVKDWHKCFADNVAQATCSAGPPACRESYCTYLACLAPERTAPYCK